MAKVKGSIVSTQKNQSLIGRKLMIVQPINAKGEPTRAEEIAVDTVGAGIGETVLIVRGAGARKALDRPDRPDSPEDVNDCSIVGIIDRVDL